MRAAILLVSLALVGIASADTEKKAAPVIVTKPGYARFIYKQGDPLPPPAVIVLAAADGAAFKIVKVSSDETFLAVSHRAATDAERQPDVKGPQYVVEVSLREGARIGPIGAKVRVETSHPKQRMIELGVNGLVRPKPGTVAPPPPLAGTVKVTIVDPAGAPIEGAKAYLTWHKMEDGYITGSLGEFVVYMLDAAAEYNLWVAKEGFVTLATKLTGKRGDTVEKTFTLQRK